MEALKLKIFQVLTEKITVLEFENWMYNSEEFMSKINNDSFYFDVISINYKDENWFKKLEQLANKEFTEDFLFLFKIKNSCLEVMKSSNARETYQILSKLLVNYNFDSDYEIVWKFFNIHDCLETFNGSMFNENTLFEEAKFYSKQVIELTKNCIEIEDLKRLLMLDLLPFKNEELQLKITLKQKIFAFLKKS